MIAGQHRPDLTIRVSTEHTAEVRGLETRRVLERLQCKKQFSYTPPSGGHPCWMIPARAVPDVVAMAEHLGGGAVVDSQQAIPL